MIGVCGISAERSRWQRRTKTGGGSSLHRSVYVSILIADFSDQSATRVLEVRMPFRKTSSLMRGTYNDGFSLFKEHRNESWALKVFPESCGGTGPLAVGLMGCGLESVSERGRCIGEILLGVWMAAT